MEPTFATTHPYRLTTLLVLAILTAFLLAGTAASIFELDSSSTAPAFFFANLALALLVAALLTKLRWWKHIGFQAATTPRDLRLYWLPFAMIAVNLSNGFADMGVGRMVYFLLLAALIGFVEESVFRGLILRAIIPRGRWKAVAISTVLFGLLHSMNVAAGADVLATVLQIGYALAIGFGFAAVALRTQVIWPLVIAHALMDFTSFLAFNGADSGSPTTTDMLVSAGLILAFTAYGLAMMRRDIRPRAVAPRQTRVPVAG